MAVVAGLGFVSFAVWPQQFTFIIAYSLIMGIGLGAFIAGTPHSSQHRVCTGDPHADATRACACAVDFALATECMPSEKTRGTDLAVWALSSSLPITVSGPLGGLMLDNGQVRPFPWRSPACDRTMLARLLLLTACDVTHACRGWDTCWVCPIWATRPCLAAAAFCSC
jgi:MFS family permease